MLASIVPLGALRARRPPSRRQVCRVYSADVSRPDDLSEGAGQDDSAPVLELLREARRAAAQRKREDDLKNVSPHTKYILGLLERSSEGFVAESASPAGEHEESDSARRLRALIDIVSPKS